ncbi:MAG TPA: hypothetical protein VFX27_05080, partial [Sphingobium sp.]|nr:hypothetical protein [Sphingobium sp.]
KGLRGFQADARTGASYDNNALRLGHIESPDFCVIFANVPGWVRRGAPGYGKRYCGAIANCKAVL